MRLASFSQLSLKASPPKAEYWHWEQLIHPAREVAWQVFGKRAGGWARTEISKRYGGWQQRGGKGERAGTAEEE